MLKKPSPSIDERLVTHVAGEDPDDEIVAGLARAARIARENAARLHAAAEAVNRDQSQPEAGRRRAISAAAMTIGPRVAAELDRARAMALAEMRRVTEATGAPPAPQDPAALQIDGELRAVLRRLTHEDRGRALSDDRVLAAALRGPGLLSGMGDAEQRVLAERYRRTAHPAAAGRIEQLNKAVAALDRVGTVFTDYAGAAAALGEDRRYRQRREPGWTPEQRAIAIFDDTDPTLQREDVLRWREECAKRGDLDD